MKDHEPTVTSRMLGAGLRIALAAGGMNASKVATLLGWSASKVSRMLSGKRVGSTEDVAAFLAVCGVVGAERNRLLTLARDCYQLGWWQDHGHCPRARFRVLDELETNAVTITSYQPLVVPANLRTTDYARALLQANPNVPTEEIDGQLAVHHERQAVIDRPDSPAFRFFIDERVVTHANPDPDLMSEQVHHLLRLSVRHNVEIRVVRDTTVLSDRTPFLLFTFQELRPIVCLENLTSTEFLERQDSVTAYRNVAAHLNRTALDQPSTRGWLTAIGEGLGRRSLLEVVRLGSRAPQPLGGA